MLIYTFSRTHAILRLWMKLGVFKEVSFCDHILMSSTFAVVVKKRFWSQNRISNFCTGKVVTYVRFRKNTSNKLIFVPAKYKLLSGSMSSLTFSSFPNMISFFCISSGKDRYHFQRFKRSFFAFFCQTSGYKYWWFTNHFLALNDIVSGWHLYIRNTLYRRIESSLLNWQDIWWDLMCFFGQSF